MWTACLLRALCCLLLCSCTVGAPVWAQARADIWLAPLDPLPRPGTQPRGADDYFELFQKDAAWPDQLAISTFKIYPYFMSRASDEQLQTMLAFLRAHHVQLALEVGVLKPDAGCGGNVEGFLGEHVVNLVRRIARLGATLDYLAMDEPLWFGHFYRGARACQRDIKSLAVDAGAQLREVRALMPGIRIGDVEPVPGTAQAEAWRDALRLWVQSLAQALGAPLDFLHADVNWSYPWQENLHAAQQTAQALGLSFGVIYNGRSSDNSDAQWADSAIAHYESYEALYPPPDTAVFQTWAPWPKSVLPVSRRDSLSGIVRSYQRPFPQLRLLADAEAPAAQIRDARQQPLAGMPLLLEQDNAQGASLLTLSGEVPAQATQALLALRLNLECACGAAGALQVRGARWKQSDDWHEVALGDPHWQIQSPGARRLLQRNADGSWRLELRSPQDSLLANSPAFAVKPGPVQLQLRLDQLQLGGEIGQAGLILLDAQGHEQRRLMLRIDTQWQPLLTLNSDGQGQIRWPALPPGRYRLRFAGDANYRALSLSLP